MAILTSRLSNPCLQTRKRAIPINIYSVDQIGPNKSLGGVHDGLASETYHVVIWGKVAAVPMAPEKKTIRIEAISRGISFKLNFSTLSHPRVINIIFVMFLQVS